MALITLICVLFFIMDALGNLSSYLQMVKELSPKRRRIVVMREMGFALITMVLFVYLGDLLLSMLNISEPAVRLASGLILFLTALKILFLSPTSLRAQLPKGEPFLIPLAIPLIAGPSLLATIMLYAHTEPSQLTMLGAILIAWFASVLILLNAETLKRLLGNNGLVAFERLTGMLLILLAIQRFLEGVQQAITHCCGK